MNFIQMTEPFLSEQGVARSTMMGSTCLRYQGEFVTMMFERQDALIIKVSPEKVNQLIEDGKGVEFNYTGKRFKEWVMIPLEFQDDYSEFVQQALDYAITKSKG